jgi:hypothetical protein
MSKKELDVKNVILIKNYSNTFIECNTNKLI